MECTDENGEDEYLGDRLLRVAKAAEEKEEDESKKGRVARFAAYTVEPRVFCMCVVIYTNDQVIAEDVRQLGHVIFQQTNLGFVGTERFSQ